LILVLTVIGAIIYLGFIYVDVTDRKWGDSSSQKKILVRENGRGRHLRRYSASCSQYGHNSRRRLAC
jgi:hypothetical protein